MKKFHRYIEKIIYIKEMTMSQNIPRQTILVVDDTPANIDVVKNLLSENYLVQAAVNGKTALKIVNKKSRI